jgi:hypothetical protein
LLEDYGDVISREMIVLDRTRLIDALSTYMSPLYPICFFYFVKSIDKFCMEYRIRVLVCKSSLKRYEAIDVGTCVR